MRKKDFLIKESEMDDYQRRIVNRRSEDSLIVRGCAGSGKSLLAFWRLHDIVHNNKGSVQVIVYTKSLKEYFVYGCQGFDIDSELIDYWWHWDKNSRTTDYIIVDEAQDFTEDDIRRFASHAKRTLLLYGDSSQQIYSFAKPTVTMEEIARITNIPEETLVYNHRLPKRIARVAQYLNVEKDVLEERCREEGYEKPYFLRYDSVESQLDAIANIIRTRELEDVGILLPTNDCVKSAVGYLRQKGVPIEFKYSLSSEDRADTLNFSTANPKILTYHSAKGLQFQTVFIPECEDNLINNRNHNAFYVAMTRSYSSLYLLYSNMLPRILNNVPENLYNASLRKETIFI